MITRLSHLMIKGIFIALIGVSATAAQMSDSTISQSIFDVMQHQEVLELTLETDINALENQRNTEEYQTGFIHFADQHKIDQAWKVKVRPRGKFRRRTCAMPPLKLKFKKAELATAGLSEFNDLKLVTHCSESKTEAKEWLMKEYLAYRLYNELTPNSFRVQMVKITYVDVPTGKKTKNWGFLIEDKDQVADRMGATVYEKNQYNPEAIDAESEKLMAVFQYFIGNEDWNMAMVRNLKLMEVDGTLIPVPYDFDFSGLVNTSYAVPNVNFGLTSVTERHFMGTLQSDDDISSTIDYFKSKEKDLLEIVRNFKDLNFGHRATVSNYLVSFYKNVDELNSAKEISAGASNFSTPTNVTKVP